MYEFLIECIFCKKSLKIVVDKPVVNVEQLLNQSNWGRVNIRVKNKKINAWICNECLAKAGLGNGNY